MLNLDTAQLDPAYYESWMLQNLRRIQAKVNDKDLVMGQNSLQEVHQALLSTNVPDKLRGALTHLRDVLQEQQEYYSFPVRSDPSRAHEGPIVDQFNRTTRPLYLITQVDGRVLDRFDRPCNWGKTATGNQFLPLKPKPVSNFEKWL